MTTRQQLQLICVLMLIGNILIVALSFVVGAKVNILFSGMGLGGWIIATVAVFARRN